ncbi:hypothetical protein BGM09_00820 [Streptomyces sp. CBMA29]|nr:hypothetical protein [Streptomyces sp. CBMA29]
MGHAPHKHPDSYATGIVPGGSGKYFQTAEAAQLDYVQRIADDYGLVVGPPHSVLVRPGHGNILANHARAVKDSVEGWRTSDDLRPAGDALATRATELAKDLQKLKLFQRDVYTESELLD